MNRNKLKLFRILITVILIILVDIYIITALAQSNLTFDVGNKYTYEYSFFGVEATFDVYVTESSLDYWKGILVSIIGDVTAVTKFKIDKNNNELFTTDPLKPEKIYDDEIEGFKIIYGAQSPIGSPLIIIYNSQLHNFNIDDLISTGSVINDWQTFMGKKNTEITIEGPLEYNNYNSYKISIVETDEIIYISTIDPYILIDLLLSSSKVITLENITTQYFDESNYNITSYPNKSPRTEFNFSIEDNIVNFDASDSCDVDGKIINYFWDFGDGNTGSGKITSHQYFTSGEYTVKLSATDDEDTSGFEFKTISINISDNNGTNQDDNINDSSSNGSNDNSNDSSSNGSNDNKTPGLGFFIFIIALLVIVIFKYKRNKF